MTDVNLTERFEMANAFVKDAAVVALEALASRPKDWTPSFKGPQDYVTATDMAVEKLFRERVAATFGDDVMGEEAGGENNSTCWVIDPIDGTANFARGIPHFCISIAYRVNFQTELGLIYDIVHDELYAARRGEGATLNGKPIATTTLADLGAATVEVGWSPRVPVEQYLAAVGQVLQAGANVKRTGSAALCLAYLAAGRIDGYFEASVFPWDVLAGTLIVEEAGGLVSYDPAVDTALRNSPIMATAPKLAAAMRQALSSTKE